MQNLIDPSNNQNPFDDYMLDALEHNIEKTIVPPDPLMAKQNFLIDDIGKQLEQVEASILNTPLKPSDVNSDIIPPTQGGEIFGIEPPLINVNNKQTPNDNSIPIVPQNSSAKSHLHSEGKIERNQNFGQPKGYNPLFGGRTNAQSNISLRPCPESHELIDIEKCESCEKYRHWPDGTNDEPRECWHDWQSTHSQNDEENNDSDEY